MMPIRIAGPLPLEQFLSPNPLRIVPIPDLQPGRVIRQGSPLRLADDALQVPRACKFEKGFAVFFDVIAV